MFTLFDNSRLCGHPPDERTDAEAPSGVDPAQVHGPLVARGEGVQESEPDANALGRQLLAAIEQVKATLAAPKEPVAVAPAPPTRDVPRAALFDVQAALAAVENATTEEEVMAALNAFVEGAEPVVQAASDPFAALTTIFGSECVATTMAVCAAAVVDLEAEAAATGGPITDRAASRIVRSMVDRVTRRAGSTMVHALRALPVPRARALRAPRARRAPRRAVRLSAVASAGDGPPPPSPDSHAPTRARDRTQVVRTSSRHLLVAQRDDVAESLGDLRERDLTSASRAVVRGVMRRRFRLFRVSLSEPHAVRLEALVKLRWAALRPRYSLEQVQHLGQAFDAAENAVLIVRALELVTRSAVDRPRAWSQRRPAMVGHRDAPRSALDAGGAGRSTRAPRQRVNDVIAKGGPACAPVLGALMRDALRDELRVVVDADPVGSSSTLAMHGGPPARSRAPARSAWARGAALSISHSARCSMPGLRRTPSIPPTIKDNGDDRAMARRGMMPGGSKAQRGRP